MPVEYRIDPARKLVVATPRGTLTAPDLFGYQKEVWTRPELQTYSELVDMRDVGKILYESPERVREVAAYSATMDPPQGGTKLAIVAAGDETFGLARMYQSYREANPRSSRRVRAFRTMPEALAWLFPEGESSKGGVSPGRPSA